MVPDQWIQPLTSIGIASVTLVLVLRQLSVARAAHYARTLIDLENSFWRDFKGTYTEIENGNWDSKEPNMAMSDWTAIESYLGYFNSLGTLVRFRSLPLKMVLSVYPYRLKQVLQLPITQHILSNHGENWEGLLFLSAKFAKLKRLDPRNPKSGESASSGY